MGPMNVHQVREPKPGTAWNQKLSSNRRKPVKMFDRHSMSRQHLKWSRENQFNVFEKEEAKNLFV